MPGKSSASKIITRYTLLDLNDKYGMAQNKDFLGAELTFETKTDGSQIVSVNMFVQPIHLRLAMNVKDFFDDILSFNQY